MSIPALRAAGRPDKIQVNGRTPRNRTCTIECNQPRLSVRWKA